MVTLLFQNTILSCWLSRQKWAMAFTGTFCLGDVEVIPSLPSKVPLLADKAFGFIGSAPKSGLVTGWWPLGTGRLGRGIHFHRLDRETFPTTFTQFSRLIEVWLSQCPYDFLEPCVKDGTGREPIQFSIPIHLSKAWLIFATKVLPLTINPIYSKARLLYRKEGDGWSSNI